MLKTLRKAILSATAALMASIVVLAQGPQTVRGTVTDPSGETVVGGSVFVKGTQTGTVTDIDGTYVLNGVRPGNVLVFSCIGYVTQEITWNSGPLNVVLQNDTQMLEETVVVGYGVQKKVNLTGAVSQVKGDDFAQRPVVDAAQALQAAPPQQIQQQGLRLILRLVGGGDAGILVAQALQKAVAQDPRRFLQTQMLFPGKCRHVPGAKMEAKLPRHAPFPDEDFVPVRFFPAKMVIIVGALHTDARFLSKREHHMGKADGIRPAAEGADHPIGPIQHGILPEIPAG